jgi:SAM-dependent methyltransferase
LDRHALYELCAQAPQRDVRILRAMHGGEPRVLGEDFSGSGALSRAWVRLVKGGRAVAVDHDGEPLERLQREARRARAGRRIKVIRADVVDVRDEVDLVAVLNFSICELHTRAELVEYLSHARQRLRAGGILVCDLYGGADSFLTGRVRERRIGPCGERITYTWEQRTADPLTGRVVNAMHFRIAPGAKRGRRPEAVELRDAFVYDWRLWSVPELREVMVDAGYASTAVYPRFAGAMDVDGGLFVCPIEDAAELDDSFAVYVVGRVGEPARTPASKISRPRRAGSRP